MVGGVIVVDLSIVQSIPKATTHSGRYTLAEAICLLVDTWVDSKGGRQVKQSKEAVCMSDVVEMFGNNN